MTGRNVTAHWSYLNCVRVVQPQVVEPHGETTTRGVEDPHGALLRQIMKIKITVHCVTLHYTDKYQIFYRVSQDFTVYSCIQCSSIGLIVL